MKIPFKINNSIIIIMSTVVLCSCSSFQTATFYELEKNTLTWEQVPTNDKRIPPSKIFHCNGSNIFAFPAPMEWTIYSFGPPFIPFIPIFIKSTGVQWKLDGVDELVYDLHIMIGFKGQVINKLKKRPKIVAITTSGYLLTLSENDFDKVLKGEEDGYVSYLYRFKEKKENIDGFSITFNEPSLGCDVPSLNYKKNKKKIYIPFSIY